MLETEEQREWAQMWFDIAKDGEPLQSEKGCDCFLCEFGRQVNDLVAIVQLLDAEGKRLGLYVQCEVRDDRIVVRLDDGLPLPIYCFVTMTRARELLSQWIQLPDGDKERAELALRSPS